MEFLDRPLVQLVWVTWTYGPMHRIKCIQVLCLEQNTVHKTRCQVFPLVMLNRGNEKLGQDVQFLIGNLMIIDKYFFNCSKCLFKGVSESDSKILPGVWKQILSIYLHSYGLWELSTELLLSKLTNICSHLVLTFCLTNTHHFLSFTQHFCSSFLTNL